MGLLSARILITAYFFLMLSLSIEAAVYYVSTDGDDAADGTTTGTAWRTITRSINRIIPPDTLQIRGGEYREQVTVTNAAGWWLFPIAMEAFSNETVSIRGSDVVTGWTYHANNIWKKTGWTNRPQQVFCDNTDLQMIGWPNDYLATNTFGCSPAEHFYIPYGHTCSEINSHHTIPVNGLAEIIPGSFYYDSTNKTLYIKLINSSSPNDHVIEVSVRSRIFVVEDQARYVTAKNIDFRHCNTMSLATKGWAGVVAGPNSVFENCAVSWCDAYGIQMDNNAEIINSSIDHNGMSGVAAMYCTNFRVVGCTITSNNFRNISSGYVGGLKIIPHAGGIVESNDIAYNYCNGVWFDTCQSNHPIIIRNNHIHHNAPHPDRANDSMLRLANGIFIEKSQNACIYNNIISSNVSIGIALSASSNTRVYNNTIIGTAGKEGFSRGLYAITVCDQEGMNSHSNLIYNNLIFGNDCDYDLRMDANNGTSSVGNFSDFNCFFRPTSATNVIDSGIIIPDSHIALSCEGLVFSNLPEWTAETGWDANSIDLDPHLFGYYLQTSSPCINAGTNQPWITISNDYYRGKRIVDETIDIGATELGALNAVFEATPQTAVIPFCSVFNGKAIATNGSATWYGWDFNDDGILDLQGSDCAIVTNCYTQASPYTVSLIVSNLDGHCATGRVDGYIDARVQEPPEDFWFRAFALTNSTSIRWQNPPMAGVSNQLVLVRWATEDYPADIDSGQLLYSGTNQWCLHTNLTPGITYHYSIWTSQDGCSFTTPP